MGDGVPSTDCLIEINLQRTTHPKKHCYMGEVLLQRLSGRREALPRGREVSGRVDRRLQD